MQKLVKAGFEYTLNIKHKDGCSVESFHCKNLVPTEGLDEFLSILFKGSAAPSALYIGLWSGALVPNGSEKASTIQSAVSEVSAYGSTRTPVTFGAVADGVISNIEDVTRFDMTGAAVINGVFMSTVPTIGSSGGKLLSVARFATPRTVDASMYIEVITGFQLVSI